MKGKETRTKRSHSHQQQILQTNSKPDEHLHEGRTGNSRTRTTTQHEKTPEEILAQPYHGNRKCHKTSETKKKKKKKQNAYRILATKKLKQIYNSEKTEGTTHK